MTFYVCGPMRGYPLFNFPAFDEATAILRMQGHRVVNPAEHDRSNGFDEHRSIEEQNFDTSKAFRWDIEQILQCDAMYCLRNWEASRGAQAEHAVARMLGMYMEYESDADKERYVYSWATAVPR